MKEWGNEHCKDHARETGGGQFFQHALDALRVFAALLGIVAIGLGLFYVVTTFELVRKGVLEPDKYEESISSWEKVLDVDGTVVETGGGASVDVSRPIAVLVFVGLLTLLALLALGIVGAGAKIISLTTSDAAAVKRVLRHAFGRTKGLRDAEEKGSE